MKTAALYDVDSRIPNLALMKLSAWHKARGWEVRLIRHSGDAIPADAHFAATIFHRASSRRRVAALREQLGDSLVVGGTGWNLHTRLTFRSNGYNWEKYLRWLNRLYFRTYGRYYRPLVEIIYRYNNKERIARYLRQPELLTTELYRSDR